jgi:2,3-bisphosphoglycerate-independent phosphoglycerate mutase
VPFAVCQPGNVADDVAAYGERDALNGALGALKGGELMDVLLKG